MDAVKAVELVRDALIVALMIAAPPIGAGLTVGILVSIIQTTMSIQEQTLTFVPKIVAMVFTLAFFGQWMLKVMTDYTARLFINLLDIVR